MKNLYLIRHGETLWNCEFKTQGCKNIKLSTKGILQGQLLANRIETLNGKDLDIYSSDLDRCYDTAKLIGKKVNKEVKVIKELREMNFGLWEGLKIKEIKKQYRDEYNTWRNSPIRASIPKGENLIDVQNRCLRAVNEILKHSKKNIVMISHGVAIKTIILGILDLDLSNFYKITQHNACLNKIEFRNYGPVLIKLNDTSHLDNSI